MTLKMKNIIWFEHPDKKKSTMTVGKNGLLRLSEYMDKELPPFIKIGFDSDSRTLIVAKYDEGANERQKYKKSKVMSVSKLVDTIHETGLQLPVKFDFTYDKNNSCWVGKVVLKKGKSGYDMEQIMALFKPAVDALCKKVGKTTPKEDRQATIKLALCDAATSYKASYGDFEQYVINYAEKVLRNGNKQFVRAAATYSLDVSLCDNDSFNLHSVVEDHNSTINNVEDRIVKREFISKLSGKDRLIVQMLSTGNSIAEISKQLNCTEDEVMLIGENIGNRYKKFEM